MRKHAALQKGVLQCLRCICKHNMIWAGPTAKIKPESFIIFECWTQFVRVLLLNMSFITFLLSPFCSATWGINRLHLLHPCVCPSVLENNTAPNILVRPASYRGGQGSPDILSHINWQLHAGPSETCLPDREQGSNAPLKCVKNDTFMLLLNNNRLLRMMQCPI